MVVYVMSMDIRIGAMEVMEVMEVMGGTGGTEGMGGTEVMVMDTGILNRLNCNRTS